MKTEKGLLGPPNISVLKINEKQSCNITRNKLAEKVKTN